MTRRFPPVVSTPRFSKCVSPSPLGSPIVTRDPPSFPRPGGHVRRVLSRTRGYVGLLASGRSDGATTTITVGGDNFVGAIPHILHTQVYGEERNPGHLYTCARNSKRTKRTRQGGHGRRELSMAICPPIFDGASQFFCLPILLITYSA